MKRKKKLKQKMDFRIITVSLLLLVCLFLVSSEKMDLSGDKSMYKYLLTVLFITTAGQKNCSVQLV